MIFKKRATGISIFIIGLFFVAKLAFAQSPMTLKECIEYARRNAPSYEQAKNDYVRTINTYKAFKAGYLPQLELNGSAPGVERAINEIVQPDGSSIFEQQNKMFSRANLSLSQFFAPTGATFYLSSSIARMDMFGSVEDSYWLATPVSVAVTQPVFKYNEMKGANKIQDMRNRNAQKKFNETMEDIAIDVANAYFNVYISKMEVQNSKFNVAVNDTMYKVSEGRYKVGKIAENDLLQNELALINSRISLEQAQLELENNIDNLKLLMGMAITEKLEIEPEPEIPEFSVNYDRALEAAMKYRSDILDYEISRTQADMNVKRVRSDNNFNADVTASFGLNQTAGNVPDAYDELLNQERINLTFSVPLFQWGKAKYEYEAALAEKENVKTETEYAMKQFKQNLKYQTARFEQHRKQLLVAEKSMNIAKRRFDVAKNRYMVSKIDMDSFYRAQNEKDTAFTGYIRALKAYWIAYYRIRRLTLYDFNVDAPINYSL